MKSIPAWRLSPTERDGLAADGYVVREALFTPSEVDDMIGACERLIDDLARDRRGHRMKAGSYVFDPDFERDVIIKWEGDTDVLHGVEPCSSPWPTRRTVGPTSAGPIPVRPGKREARVSAPNTV